MKLKKSWLALLAASGVLLSTLAVQGANTWTILVYGSGDNNLAPSLVMDMLKMEQVGSSPGFNIVVEADFDAAAKVDGVPVELGNSVGRYLIQTNTSPGQVTSPAVEKLPDASLDDPAVLQDFISWGMQKYPADRYGLILWDHGGQFYGFGGDTRDGTVDGSAMNTAQILKAASAALQGAKVSKFDFVGYDTCLMGGIEVLPDTVPLTDVFIACPEIDMGDGWNYTEALGYLKANPNIRSLDFAIYEASTWKALHLQPGNRDDLALAAHSVYDLTKYTDVIQAFNTFGAALKAEATAANAWIPQTRLQTTQYWIRGVKDAGKNTDFTDLGEFAQRIARNSNASATLSSAASSLTTTIQSLVVAKVQGTLRTNALGLSVYYPTGGSTTNQTYLDLSLSKLEGASWPAYLAVVQANANGTAPTLEVTADGSTNLTASLDQPATVRVLLSNTTNAYSYRAVVVKSDIAGDSNAVLYLGEVTLGSTQGASAVAFAWDGRLPSLSAGAGSPAIPFGGFFDEVDPSVLTAYARYTPPASTNTELVILLAQMGSDGSWQVTDSLDASGAAENMAPRGVKLQAGGTLTPLYYLEYRVGTDPEQWTGDYSPAAQSVIIPASGLSGLTLALSPLPPATYTVEVEVLDCYGDTSDPVDFAITAQTSTLPSLQIAPSTSGHVQLSWPVNPAGFVLQSASALKAGGWTDVSLAGLTTDGTNNKLIEAETGSAQFYRLVKP